MPTPPDRLRSWLAMAAILVLAWWIYQSGLAGGFLFDDYNNLDALGKQGAIRHWPEFWRYITSGIADPLGRPLALASFLVDARDWPAPPAPFLYTNILLHLVNGVLLFGLLGALDRPFRQCRPDPAWLAAGAWLLHPFFVSTTLYVVQREAMLCATFTFAALWGYVVGREAYIERRHRKALALLVTSLVAGTLAAALSKANGVLLPLLAWSLEATVLAAADRRAARALPLAFVRCRWAVAVLPSVIVIGYVGSFLLEPGARYSREWSVLERVLTEMRILPGYLASLAIPRALYPGIVNDDVVLSTGWLHPLTTLPSVAAMAAMLAAAIAWRRRFPIPAAAALFFLAGHLLESSAIPLELYFEHRNYLPAALLFWPVARAWSSSPAPAWLRNGAGLAALLLMAAICSERVRIWASPDTRTATWLQAHPDSARALIMRAEYLRDANQGRAAERLLAEGLSRRPDDLILLLAFAGQRCADGGIDRPLARRLEATLATWPRQGSLTYRWLDAGVDMAQQGSCPGLDESTVRDLVAAAASNRHLGGPRDAQRNLESLRGRLALMDGDAELAARHFDASLDAVPSPETAARQTVMLAQSGHEDVAARFLDRNLQRVLAPRRLPPGMPRIHAWVLDQQAYWPTELRRLRQSLHAPPTPAIPERAPTPDDRPSAAH